MGDDVLFAQILDVLQIGDLKGKQ